MSRPGNKGTPPHTGSKASSAGQWSTGQASWLPPVTSSALATLKYLQELDSYGVNWKSYTEQYLDSAGIFKDAIISLMATLAKQERLRISERTIAGMERARAKGKRIGRPPRFWDREKAREMRRQGASLGQIAKRFRVARSTVHRLVKEG